MAAKKGMKLKKGLTKEQQQKVLEILDRDGTTILYNKHFKELGLNRRTYNRRRAVSDFKIETGFSRDEWEIAKCKQKIEFFCENCGQQTKTLVDKIRNRKYEEARWVCQSCVLRITANTKGWREANSRAQFIAQNRPEVKAKNRQAQFKRHQEPKMKERYRKIGKELWENQDYRDKQIEIMLKRWREPEYAKKASWNGRSKYQGYYSGIFYQSLVELSFILWKDGKVERYELKPIPYLKEGKIHSYYPDFIIDSTIIEVKGSLKGYYNKPERRELIRIKQKAAEEYCRKTGRSYRIVVKKDIPTEFYKKAKEIHCGKNNQKND